ncbi:hypothetical protein L7F22_024973 [Adiantum nelumboides]|nr:hypothetical protein [Adiantum nelumboides]
MGEPSSSWQNINFRDDEGSAQGMQALRLLLAKLQEAQANPRLKPSVNNLLMTEDLMLTSTQRLPSSVAPMHLEGGEGVPVMHGPMQANVVPHPLQGPLQTDGAKKKQYHGQERHVGKIREEGDFHDDDDEPPSRSRHKKRTNERRTKRSRRNSSGGSSSSSQSGRSSHGRFPKKEGDLENKMGEPSSSWQNFNFRDDEGSAQGMQALRLLLAKLQEAQANPRLKPSVNNLLMTEDLMLTSTQRLPSSVAPMHLEGGEGVPVMHGPMQANVVPHPLQGPLQTDGAKKKQYQGQERHVGKIREEGDFHDDDDEPPSRSRHKKRINERRTKRSRRNSSGGSSSSSQSGRSSHGRFPKKEGDLENKMGEPSSSWQNFNFRDDEGSAQGMQALRLLLAKLQEAQANPRLKPSVNNLLMTEDLMLTSTQRLPSSVAPMHLEGGEGVPVMHGPMQANLVPHPLQGPLQTDGAKKKQYHGQERHVGKIREEGDFHDDDDEPPSRSRHKKRTNERRTKRSRRNSSGGSSSSSQSGRSSHGRFPKKGSRESPTTGAAPGGEHPVRQLEEGTTLGVGSIEWITEEGDGAVLRRLGSSAGTSNEVRGHAFSRQVLYVSWQVQGLQNFEEGHCRLVQKEALEKDDAKSVRELELLCSGNWRLIRKLIS